MLMIAIALFAICALGLCAMGAKYCFGPVPADYHLKIMGLSKSDLSPQQITVFSAIYRVMGAGFFALAIALASLSFFAVSLDLMWAKLTVLIVGLVAGIPALRITYSIHKKTGVETPWKPAAAIVIILLLAFILSVL